MLESLSLFSNPLLILAQIIAQTGSLEWTPTTFYIAAAVLHLVIILIMFRLLQLEPEYNTFIGALIAAGISNGIAFFLKDFEIFGVLGSGAVYFGLLVAISQADVLKAVYVWVVVIASYAGLAFLILPRAHDLTIEQIGGIPQVVMSGGLKAEPFTDDAYDNLSSGNIKSVR